MAVKPIGTDLKAGCTNPGQTYRQPQGGENIQNMKGSHGASTTDPVRLGSPNTRRRAPICTARLLSSTVRPAQATSISASLYPVAPRARAAMRRHGGPTKWARRRGTMCPSPHQGATDRGCTLRPSPDLAPVQKRLRTFSAQFHDFRPVRAQIATA